MGAAASAGGGGSFGIGVLAMVLAAQTIYVGVYIPGAPPNYKDVTKAFSMFSGNIRRALAVESVTGAPQSKCRSPVVAPRPWTHGLK